MPNAIDAIRKRRSIRKFSPRPVTRELVLEVLKVAGWAPSAHNAQPWRFIILEDSKARRELANAMANARAADLAKDGIKISEADYRASTQRFADSPVLILACLSMEDMKKFSDHARQGFELDLAMQSVVSAVQSLFFAATYLPDYHSSFATARFLILRAVIRQLSLRYFVWQVSLSAYD